VRSGRGPKDPATWTVENPGFVPGYVPRYYQFGPGDTIPIYNLANLYFDPDKKRGSARRWRRAGIRTS
jgi:hypothetical protein